jgi:microcystin-dependent protein/GNAT superfamily N-acetyltransferase
MADPFVAEIRIFPFNFVPKGWAACEGQLLPISQNTALFSLLGTMYGGDGKVTYALPDLRDRVPMRGEQGAGLTARSQGESGGTETVTLLESEMPVHTHTLSASGDLATATQPAGRLFAQGDGIGMYGGNAETPARAAGASPGRRLAAPQQHAAVPDASVLHRAAGDLPRAKQPADVIELRPIGDGDREMLLELYGSTRAAELELVNWDDRGRRTFVEQQFAAQDLYYRNYHPAASFDVVIVDGEPVGRLCVDRREDEIRILDIALLPRMRGRGIGTRLLTGLIEAAEAEGRRLTAHVVVGNPARSLYERLGFEAVPSADDGLVTHALLVRA